MSVRRLPVRPDLEQLLRQAKEFLRAIHAGDARALAEFREHHPGSIDPAAAKLADVQLALARSYQTASWTRLVHAVRLAEAIWRDDEAAVRELVTRNPALIHEQVLIRIGPDGQAADWHDEPPDKPVVRWRRAKEVRDLHPNV